MNIFQNYRQKFYNLSNAVTNEDIEQFGFDLTTYTMAYIFIIGSTISIFFGLHCKIYLPTIVFYWLFIVTTALGLIWLVDSCIDIKLKHHVLGLTISLWLLLTYIVYYNKLFVAYWFIFLILAIVARLNTRSTVSCYLIASFLMFIEYTFAYNNYSGVTLYTGNYISILMMVLFTLGCNELVIRLNRTLVGSRIAETQKLTEKNKEILSLYEILSANEEELRVQYESLEKYNMTIMEKQSELEFLANNDELTGILNRKRIYEFIQAKINSGICPNERFFVGFIDLDNFKAINDVLGHNTGDDILKLVAKKLSQNVNAQDVFGRLGGDEFAIIIHRAITNEVLEIYLNKICNLFEEELLLKQKSIKVTASIGVAEYPKDGKTAVDLMKAADTAMYKAKSEGKKKFRFYNKDIEQLMLQRVEMENSLVRAIRNKEFYFEYQPIFDIITNKVELFEALIRWKKPNGELISPASFIPFAEEKGYINEIGEWGLNEVCKKIKELEKENFTNIKIAYNISTVQMDTPNFVEKVTSIIKKHDIKPNCLEFELTESVIIKNKQIAIEKINLLKKLGISISLDDFGTGFSSLSYLTELPIDILKIDKAFIDKIGVDYKVEELITFIIHLVHKMQIKVISEGIETNKQLMFLKQNSCDLIQGFLLSKPVCEYDVKKFLDK